MFPVMCGSIMGALWLVILVIVLVLALTGLCLYFLLIKKDSDKPKKKQDDERFPEFDSSYLSGNESIVSEAAEKNTVSDEEWSKVGVNGGSFRMENTGMGIGGARDALGEDGNDETSILLDSDREFSLETEGMTDGTPLFTDDENPGVHKSFAKREEKSIFYDDDASSTQDLAEVEVPESFVFRVATEERTEVGKAEFSIGKSRNADYTVSGNNTISRLHAVLIFKNNQWNIVDNHSSNKTFLNGKQIEPDQMYPIVDQDEIMISNERFIFHTKSE